MNEVGAMSEPSGVVCMFCGEAVMMSDSDPLRVDLFLPDDDRPGSYWCHSTCLVDSVHRSIPLYQLSLRRDEAVYGRRGDDDR